MSRLENDRKVTVLTQSANFFLPDTLKVTGSTISTPKSYDEHPLQVKYWSPPLPGNSIRFIMSKELLGAKVRSKTLLNVLSRDSAVNS